MFTVNVGVVLASRPTYSNRAVSSGMAMFMALGRWTLRKLVNIILRNMANILFIPESSRQCRNPWTPLKTM